MKLEGKISTIIFKNDTNFWTVMLIKCGKDYITAVGTTTEDISVGEELEFEGEIITHKVYGEQFKFSTYKKLLPKSDIALIQYISDNVKGIGKKTAKNIVDKFGEETVNVIRYNKDKLSDIKGLNNEKIDLLNEFFSQEWEKWNTVEYLSQFNISVVTANKIFKVLGVDTINIIKENPYSLVNFVKNMDFKTVDQMGRSLGIDLQDDIRVETGLIYAITKITEFGHTCVKKSDLLNYSTELLEVSAESIDNAITSLVLQDKLYLQILGEEECVFRRSFYLAEENIANEITKHTKNVVVNRDYQKYISNISKKNNIKLSKEQLEAINMCLNNSISIITGGPGTGKTTIIKCIIEILEELKKEYVLCAPTGRAAKRIQETTGKEAKTIHRLLEITKVDDDNLDSLYEIDVTPVKSDFVIIDEASMIDTLMMNNLFKAIGIDTQIVLVGDSNQLPSVGPGNILNDIISSGVVNTIYLKDIYRQSAKSDIILNAHRVNSGEYPIFKNKDTDMYFVQASSQEECENEIASLLSYRLENFANLDILKDLQILTPMKKTSLGTVELNEKIQEILNPKKDEKKEKIFSNKIFREGDKVMQIINNYDKKFALNGEFFTGVYNGDIGYIKKIDIINEKIIVIFDETKEVVYDFEEADQLEHSYAITIHKSQGSEFDYCILPLFTAYPKLFTRNLLYTAMTRAKKMLIIVGSKKVVEYMVNNVESRKRLTGLKEKIIEKI